MDIHELSSELCQAAHKGNVLVRLLDDPGVPARVCCVNCERGKIELCVEKTREEETQAG